MDPDSLSQDEEARLEDAITVLRITQKELRLDHTRMSDLSTTQLGLVASLLAPSFGVREVMDMGGDLVPCLRNSLLARICKLGLVHALPCITALEDWSLDVRACAFLDAFFRRMLCNVVFENRQLSA